MGQLLSGGAPAGAAGRLDHIDGLRGIAALAVVIHHLIPEIGKGFDFGRYGVLVFFMVSGYVVPFSLTRKHRTPLVAFAISRLFRLYPAYWLSMALPLVLGIAVSPVHWLVNLSMLQHFLGVPDILGVYWTLAVELVFYALCAGLFALGWLGRRDRLLALLAGLTAATLASAALRVGLGWPLPFAWLGFLGLMVGGAVVRRLDEEGWPQGIAPMALTAVFVAAQIGAVVLVYADPALQRPLWNEVNAWLAAFITVLVIHARPRFCPPGAVAVGRISYSLYLFHGSVGLAAIAALGLSGASGGLVGIVVALALSALCWAAVERPCVHLGHRLVRKLEENRS